MEMNAVQITSVAGAGDIAQERLIMKASGQDDMGLYAVFNGKISDKGALVAGNVQDAYWFMNVKVNDGDLIILYTKVGTRSQKKTDDGITSHFFYWNRQKALWAPDRVPVLIATPTWQVFKRSEAIHRGTSS
jgi:hypothetical protein